MKLLHRSAETSIRAYYAMLDGPKLGDQQRKIVAFLAFHAHRDWTRAEIAEATGMRVASVCGRIHELIADQVLLELPRRACRCTGSSAHPVSLAPVQTELFAA